MIDAKKLKKSRIRAIDQGTRYDITGRLRSLARSIERGEHGTVRHVVVGVAGTLDSEKSVSTNFFGSSSVPEVCYTIDMMKKRLVGDNR